MDSVDVGVRIRAAVLEAVTGSERRLAPLRVEQDVSARLGVSRKSVRKAIAVLVSEGRLAYTHLSGTSFLEPSFERPVAVSKRIRLCRAGMSTSRPLSSNDIVIRLQAGAAFGLGNHPTTRLALRALEAAVDDFLPTAGLDVGTGSGVLAIASLRLGVQTVLALDVDPCARAEAAANARQNGVSNRLEIRNVPFDRIEGSFELVMANLRPPTLSDLVFSLSKRCPAGAAAVLSGFRPNEWPPLAEDLKACGWRCVREETEVGWMAVVCRRR